MPTGDPVICNIVHGWPDDRTVKVSTDLSGRLRMTRLGTASFLDQIGAQLRLEEVWLGPGAPARSAFTPRPTINYIADADLCGAALAAAEQLSRSVPVPWFNHPRAVLASTRDGVARALDGLPGVIVPRTLRLETPTLAEIGAAIVAHGLRAPMLVRIAGSHGGKNVVRLDDGADFDLLHTIPWGGRSLYLTELIDIRSGDGLYRKHRFAVIGGRAILRHLVIGRDWLLNFDDRLTTPGALAEERDVHARAKDEIEPGLAGTIQAMAGRLRLDYFGIDCNLRPDGSLVLFEANASMQLLHNSFPSPNLWDRPIARCRAALFDLLGDCDRWMFGKRPHG